MREAHCGDVFYVAEVLCLAVLVVSRVIRLLLGASCSSSGGWLVRDGNGDDVRNKKLRLEGDEEESHTVMEDAAETTS